MTSSGYDTKFESKVILQKPNPPMDALMDYPMRSPLRDDLRDKNLLKTNFYLPTLDEIKDKHVQPKLKYNTDNRNPVGAIPFIGEESIHPEITSDIYCKTITNPDPNNIHQTTYSCVPSDPVVAGDLNQLKQAPKYEQFWSSTDETTNKQTMKIIAGLLTAYLLYTMYSSR